MAFLILNTDVRLFDPNFLTHDFLIRVKNNNFNIINILLNFNKKYNLLQLFCSSAVPTRSLRLSA